MTTPRRQTTRPSSADPRDRTEEIAASWRTNADAWTAAVREGRIASRRAGTDAAVVHALRRLEPRRVLDLGCGEGWLARELAALGCHVTGLDESVALVERATELGGGDFHVASYDSLIERPELAGGPHDAVVLNFALFAEDVVPLLSVVRDMLAPRGAVVIQTVHPWTASVDVPYADGWRVETFDAFGAAFARPMPWYFRTLASWTEEIAAAGLAIERLEEPTDPASGRPLSLLLTAVRRAAR